MSATQQHNLNGNGHHGLDPHRLRAVQAHAEFLRRAVDEASVRGGRIMSRAELEAAAGGIDGRLEALEKLLGVRTVGGEGNDD